MDFAHLSLTRTISKTMLCEVTGLFALFGLVLRPTSKSPETSNASYGMRNVIPHNVFTNVKMFFLPHPNFSCLFVADDVKSEMSREMWK